MNRVCGWYCVEQMLHGCSLNSFDPFVSYLMQCWANALFTANALATGAPEDTSHRANGGVRRWVSIKPILSQIFLFAVVWLTECSVFTGGLSGIMTAPLHAGGAFSCATGRKLWLSVHLTQPPPPPPLRRATPGSVNHTRKKTASHPSNLRSCQEIIYPSAVSRGTWWHVTDTWPIPTVSTQTALPTSHFHFRFQNSLLSTGYGLFDQTKNFLISFSLIWSLCSCFPATKNYEKTLKTFWAEFGNVVILMSHS